MNSDDSRGVLLRSLDIHAAALDASRAVEPDTPDVATLVLLADAIVVAMASWAAILARVVPRSDSPFAPARTGALVIESVFDELLSPCACRVLAAAVDLALGPR